MKYLEAQPIWLGHLAVAPWRGSLCSGGLCKRLKVVREMGAREWRRGGGWSDVSGSPKRSRSRREVGSPLRSKCGKLVLVLV